MKKKKQNPFPAKTGPKTTVFQKQPRAAAPPSGMNPRARNGGPHTGLTTNKSKPSGGHGSAGPTTSVDDGY